MKITYDAALRF